MFVRRPTEDLIFNDQFKFVVQIKEHFRQKRPQQNCGQDTSHSVCIFMPKVFPTEFYKLLFIQLTEIIFHPMLQMRLSLQQLPSCIFLVKTIFLCESATSLLLMWSDMYYLLTYTTATLSLSLSLSLHCMQGSDSPTLLCKAQIQCPPLNRITLGRLKSDNNNWMIKITGDFFYCLD